MQWTEVTISTTTWGADAMAEVLFRQGVAGVSIEDPADIILYQRKSDDWDYIDERIFSDRGNVVYVKGYLPSGENKKVHAIEQEAAKVASLTEGTTDFGSGEVKTRTVADEDWAENWKQYYKPFTVGQTLAVVPCWEEFDAPSRIIVRLDPGAAFGTGQHETTVMCLAFLEKSNMEGKTVLDIGCGTGILGIAAICKGAKNATLVDRDPVAVSAAIHNAQLNDCIDKVQIREGNLADQVHGPFDVIFANIVADAILKVLPEIQNLLSPSGLFIASGIIRDREEAVVQAALHCGLSAAERMQQGEWVALCLRGQG